MTTRKILTTVFLLISSIANGQLNGIFPNSGLATYALQTGITANGIFIQSSSPAGNIFKIDLNMGTDTIHVFDFFNYGFSGSTTVINADSVSAAFYILPNTPAGLYDLEVITGDVAFPAFNQTTYSLPGAFTILPPDGYISGNVFDDLNHNGIKDTGEPGINNHSVYLLPGLHSFQTNSNGDYSIPVLNGSYSVFCPHSFSNGYKFLSSNDTLPVTINNNNSTGNNFGLKDALVSVTPSTGYIGMTTLHQFVADEPIFIPGPGSSGNISNLYILASPQTIYVSLSNVTVIDSFTIQVNIPIPGNTIVSNNRDVVVNTYLGYAGYHYLRGQFDIEAPPSLISGRMFFDQNQNKVNDPGEPGIVNAGVLMTPGNSQSFSDSYGEYVIGSFGGVQTISPLNNIPGLVLFTDSVSYTFSATGNITDKDFGFISTNPDYSVDVGWLFMGRRCNTQQYARFNVRNTSNIPYDVRVWLYHDPLLSFISSPTPPSSVTADTVYWDLTLQPYTETELKALMLLPGAGNSVTLTAGATSLDVNGIDQLSDALTQVYNVSCSFDPNDKQVTPEGILQPHFTLMTDTLEYLIRFQNTGNDTAFNVVVLDTLDTSLDLSTFEILGSSHSMQTELKSNGALRFSFNNIMLVDSIANEPESHGFIRYRIKAESGLADSTEITNTAYIYFDLNVPVATNTTLNTLVYVLPVGISEIETPKAILYPNPFHLSSKLVFENSLADKYKLAITDITGKMVAAELSTTGNTFVIEKNHLREGLYFYHLLNTRTNKMLSGKMVIQ